MFSVFVDIVVKKEFSAAFKEAAEKQAENSLANEKGCIRFDVLEDPESATHFALYEVYADKATFYDVHRTTPYFFKYMETTGPWMERKDVRVWTKLAVAGDR